MAEHGFEDFDIVLALFVFVVHYVGLIRGKDCADGLIPSVPAETRGLNILVAEIPCTALKVPEREGISPL
jgi:hypothetical protein